MENTKEYFEGRKAADENYRIVRRNELRTQPRPWDEILIVSPYPEGEQHKEWCLGYSERITEIMSHGNKVQE